MTPETWLPLVAGFLLLLVVWTTWTLTRLGRLDSRVARAWSALDTQLQRRAGVAEELARHYPAALGVDHVTRLADAAAEARAPQDGDRELAENALGRVLRELPSELPGVPASLQTDLTGTATRVALARRFYNDAVRDTRALRRQRFCRLMRLHASRPMPRYFDIDDRLDVVTSGANGTGRAGSDRP